MTRTRTAKKPKREQKLKRASKAELSGVSAEHDIEEALSGRNAMARKYVLRLRKRHPDASPADIIRVLERHYSTAISTAGALITTGQIAATVAISLIPLGGAAASAGQEVAKKASKEAAKGAAKAAAKSAAKTAALGAARSGATKAASMIPAGEHMLQFEITALFALGVAEIHGKTLDRDQAKALIYGLSNASVSQKQIAIMANDVSQAATAKTGELANRVAEGRNDWSHWADTLADTMPAGAAQSFVRTIQTGEFDAVRDGLGSKQQAAIEYGVGAIVGGATRFTFGRDVVKSARDAFAEPPTEFPDHLRVTIEVNEADDAPNRALAALEDAGRATGTWITGTASAVGSTVASGAANVSRPFRSVDLDGDGIPDEAQALTAVKNVGGAISGAAGAVSGSVAGLFKRKKQESAQASHEGDEAHKAE